jgi:hypothetical protein
MPLMSLPRSSRRRCRGNVGKELGLDETFGAHTFVASVVEVGDEKKTLVVVLANVAVVVAKVTDASVAVEKKTLVVVVFSRSRPQPL